MAQCGLLHQLIGSVRDREHGTMWLVASTNWLVWLAASANWFSERGNMAQCGLLHQLTRGIGGRFQCCLKHRPTGLLSDKR